MRRVRCDLTRPSCQRCSKTGRTCDRYLTPRGIPKPSPILCGTLTPTHILGETSSVQDARVLRSLHYFQQKAAPELCGFFENDIWSTLVLQISRREPCVRQVISALGLLHESLYADEGDNLHLSGLPPRQHAIEQYSQGIVSLNAHIQTQGWASLEITLLCSILCVTFEWLRGDYSAAHAHLTSSVSILSRWGNEEHSPRSGTSPSSPGGYMIRTRLWPLWTSLVLQTRTMNLGPSLSWGTPLNIKEGASAFATLQQARKELDILLAYVIPETIGEGKRRNPSSMGARNVAHRLAEWSFKFSAYVKTAGPDEQSTPQVIIMGLWYRTSKMIFMANFFHDEVEYDAMLADFSGITTDAADLLSTPTRHFSIEIGVVPLLYYVGLKCRHPQIRRSALSLLRASPRREAVWDSKGAACVIEEIMRVEEQGIDEVRRQEDIPLAARVHRMRVFTDVEHRSIRLQTMQQGVEVWGEQRILTW